MSADQVQELKKFAADVAKMTKVQLKGSLSGIVGRSREAGPADNDKVALWHAQIDLLQKALKSKEREALEPSAFKEAIKALAWIETTASDLRKELEATSKSGDYEAQKAAVHKAYDKAGNGMKPSGYALYQLYNLFQA